jgi:hypothetical protein
MLPNVHIKTSSLTALMQTNNTGKPPATITTECSAKQKKQYFNQVAMKASEIAMCGGPKEACEAVQLLEKGSTAHHHPPQELHFQDPNTGNIATTPKANLEILHTHCHKVYNHDNAPVDFSILDDIFQHPTLNPLGMPPTTTEI